MSTPKKNQQQNLKKLMKHIYSYMANTIMINANAVIMVIMKANMNVNMKANMNTNTNIVILNYFLNLSTLS